MANIIGELVVKLAGEIKEFQSAMAQAQTVTDVAMKNISTAVTSTMNQVSTGVQRMGTNVRDGLREAAAGIGSLNEKIGPQMLQVSGALAGVTTIAMGATQGLEHLRRELEKMPKGSFSEELKKSLDSLLGVLQPVSMGLLAVTGAVSGLSVALPLLSTPIGLVVAGLAALTAAAYAMYESFQQSMEAVKGADPNFRSLGNSINLTAEELKKLNTELDKAEQKQALKDAAGGVTVRVLTAKDLAEERAKAEKLIQEEVRKSREFELKRWRDNEQAVESYGKAIERVTQKAIQENNRYMDAVGAAADEQRRKASQEQLPVVWGGRAGEMQKAGDAVVLATEDAAAKSKEAIEGVTGVWKENVKEWGTTMRSARQEVSTIMNDLGRDLAKAIIHWKGFKEAGLNALEAVGEAITRQLINKLIESTKLIDKAIELFEKLLGLGGSSKQQQSSPIPGIPGGGGGSIGLGGGGGILDLINTVANVVSAISNVISNFQNARQENTLNAIEWNTRKSSIHLEYLLEKANETWPYLQHINNTLWTPGAPGGGGGTQITVNYTGDVRSLAMMLLSELQRMGLRVSPA